MAEIRTGQVVLFYLFDVAGTADLQAIPGLVGGPAVPARLMPKPATPPYVQYEKPPVSFDGEGRLDDGDEFQAGCESSTTAVDVVALVQPSTGGGTSWCRGADAGSRTPIWRQRVEGSAGRSPSGWGAALKRPIRATGS